MQSLVQIDGKELVGDPLEKASIEVGGGGQELGGRVGWVEGRLDFLACSCAKGHAQDPTLTLANVQALHTILFDPCKLSARGFYFAPLAKAHG